MLDFNSGAVLFEDEGWRIMSIPKELINNHSDYTFFNSVVDHSCPSRGNEYCWTARALRYKNNCNHCMNTIPDSVLTLYRLNNWEGLYG